MEDASLLFSSLPNDIVLNILARVPRRYHPILSCVSKKLQSILRSSELHKTRSLMGKDSFYVCFQEDPFLIYHWFTLTKNRRLVSIPFPYPQAPEPYFVALMVGPEIYLVGSGFFNTNPSKSMWILDSRSGKLRQGPSMLVATIHPVVGIVDDKIYIIGGCNDEEIQAQVFDPKTQTWKIAANPSVEVRNIWMSVVNQSLGRKIYAKSSNGQTIIVYDSRDGNCEFINLPRDDFYYYRKDVCVIDNVLYFYSSKWFRLMWYNSKEKEWRVVPGLNLGKSYNNRRCVLLAEYNGKLALLWRDRNKMEIWCAMISLHRSGVSEVQGRFEWSDCILSNVPHDYEILHCLGRTD